MKYKEFQRKYFRLSEKERYISAVAMSLYGQGKYTFEEMSEIGKKYWLGKFGNDFGELVTEDIKENILDKKWVKLCNNYYKQYH